MRSTWERDVAYYQRRLRDQAMSPWASARRWRRRFMFSMAINILLAFLILITRAR
jgi:hypothetical protein